MGVKVGSGVAVKRSVEVGVGESGVFEGRGVLLAGSGVADAVGVGVPGVGGVAVGSSVVGTVVAAGVFVLSGGCDVLLAPGCGVLVGSGVSEAVGVGDGVLDGASVEVGVAVWALAVSVAAMTVSTAGGSVWVGAGVGVGQATRVGAKSQYIITRAVLWEVRLAPSTMPYCPEESRSCLFWLLRRRQLPMKQSSSSTAVSVS